MLSRPKPLHLKKATSLKMNGTLLLKWLVAFCVLDGVAASEFDAIASPSPVPSPSSPPILAACPFCTGRRVFTGGEHYVNPKGNYRYPRSMPPIFAGMASPERGGGASYVYDLNVTFRKDAYDADPTGTMNVTYYFELAGCTYDNITFGPGKEQPRPVQYNATGFPIDPPFCNDATGFRSGEEGKYMKNFGKFVDNYEGKGTPFVPVPTSDSTPVSKIFEFLWCPDQDRFHVTVFKQGDPVSGCPYQFRSQTSNVKALQSEKAFLQAENDRLRAEITQVQTRTVPPPPSSPSPPESVVKGSICNPALPGACGSTSNPPSGLTCVCTRRSRSLLFGAVPDGADNSDTSQCTCA